MSKDEQAQPEGDFDTVDPFLEEVAEQQAKGEEALAKEAEAPEEQETENETPAPEAASPEPQYDDTSHADDETEPAEELPAGDATDSGDDGGQDAPAEPQFDPALLADFNLTPEQAKAQFGTPEALANAGRLLDQRVLNQFQQQYATPNAQQQPGLPPAPAPGTHVEIPLEQQQTPNPATAAEFKMPETLDGEEWDEDVKRLVEHLNKGFNQQLAAQAAELNKQRQVTEAFLQQQQQQAEQAYVQGVDNFVNNLGDEWTAVLGKGSGYELGAQSPFVTARAQLDAIAQQLSNGRQVQGLPQLTQEQLLAKALPLAFPNIQQQVVRQEVEEEVGKRQRMMTQRPTGRTRKPAVSGEKAAAGKAEQSYAERGMAPLPFDDFDETEI
jgi:hypothetical protein